LVFNKKRKVKNTVNVCRFLHAFISKGFRFLGRSAWSLMGGGAGQTPGLGRSFFVLIKNENRLRAWSPCSQLVGRFKLLSCYSNLPSGQKKRRDGVKGKRTLQG